MNKKELRKSITAQKLRLREEQIQAASQVLCRQLEAHPLYREASSVYLYLSYNQEVRTEPLIQKAREDGKRVAVPKILDGDMVFLWLEEDTVIAPGYKGIPEPVAGLPADDPHALVLLPGLAFDREGHRIGYGGGFYDRFLAAEAHPTVALCFAFQLVDSLPVEAHDIPADAVLWAAIE